jgi:hypothetical protein
MLGVNSVVANFHLKDGLFCRLGHLRIPSSERMKLICKAHYSRVAFVGMFTGKVCLSLMERSEYAVMEKQGQRKLRRDSAEVHEECKSVLVYLMANRQARKTNNAGIIA